MRTIIILIVSCYSILISNGQSVFQRSYGNNSNERCQSAIPTSDGGFLLNGATVYSGFGGVDGLIVKTDASGNVQWVKICGSTANEIPAYVAETYNNQFIFIGTTDSTVGGTLDALIYKTDSAGNFLWAKTFGGSNSETGIKIIEMPDHGYVFTGTTFSYGAGGGDPYIVRTDMNGDTIFTRIYGTPNDDIGKSISLTSDGGFILCGKRVASNGGPNFDQAFLIRIDSMGDMMWTKSYGDTLFQEAQAVAQTADGGFIACGSRNYSNLGNYDILLFKTDSTGNIQWSKTYGGNSGDASYAVTVNQDGSFVVSGYTNSMGYGHSLRQSAQGAFQMADPIEILISTAFNPGDDSTNVFLMKTDANGDTIWTRSYGDSLLDEAFLSVKTPDEGFILAGYSDYHTADSTQMLVIKTDSLGFAGCNTLTSHPVIVTDLLTEFSTAFTQSSGMTMNAIQLNTMSTTVASSYCQVTYANEVLDKNTFRIFPVPTKDRLIVNLDLTESASHSDPTTLTIYDMFGKSILKNVLTNQVDYFDMDVSFIKPGMYLVEINTGQFKITRKVVKE